MTIHIIADTFLDRLHTGSVNRISPDAPVPVLEVSDCESDEGSGWMLHQHLRDFYKEETIYYTLLGDDPEGKWIIDEKILNPGSSVIVKTSRTPVLDRFVTDTGHHLLRTTRLYDDDNILSEARELTEFIEINYDKGDIVCALDYGAGLFTTDMVANITELEGARVVFRPTITSYQYVYDVELVKFSTDIARMVCNLNLVNETSTRIILNRLAHLVNSPVVVVEYDAGAHYLGEDECDFYEVPDVRYEGDTYKEKSMRFMARLLSSLHEGETTARAVEHASRHI